MTATCNSASSAATDDNCPICFDSLATKRILTLHPCMHRFHHTCIMNWFESRETFERSQFTCCLCRTVLRRPCDENGQLVMLTYAMEVKEDEIDVDRIENKANLAKLWRVISASLDKLKEDMKNAKKNKKMDEFIADIDEETAKLHNRQKATERIFIKKSLYMSVQIRELIAERRLHLRALASAFEEAKTRAQKRALEQEKDDAEDDFDVEMKAAAAAARAEFRALCAAEIAAVAARRAAAAAKTTAAELAAATAAARHAAAAARPTTRAAAKRRAEANDEFVQQPKRRR